MRLEIKNIKKGDIFYECEAGYNMQFLALEDAKRIDDGWGFKGQGIQGVVDFYVADGYSHYGPKLYSQPEYI